jgi:hypothetical protein
MGIQSGESLSHAYYLGGPLRCKRFLEVLIDGKIRPRLAERGLFASPAENVPSVR